MKNALPLVALVAALAGPAPADTIRTITGPIHEGEIVRRSDETIVLETAAGRIEIDVADVHQIVEGPSPRARLTESMDSLPREGGVEALEAAYRLARDHGFESERRKLATLLYRRADGTALGRAYADGAKVYREFERAARDRARADALAGRLPAELGLDEAFVVGYRDQLALLSLALRGGEASRIKADQARELARARNEALAFIASKRRYPPGQRPAPGQEEVDALVAEVARLHAASSDPAALRADRRLARVLAPLEAARTTYAAAGGKAAEPLRRETEAVLAAGVAVIDFAAEDERRHGPLLEANRSAEGPIDEETRHLIELVNEYRILMGVRPLAIDDKLSAAAQGHAEAMIEHGFFGHGSPIPGHRTHIDRALRAGYESNFVNEEIANGCADGPAALDGWKHSPDHHRGLVRNDMKEIGAGRVEMTWVFLMGDPDH